MRIRDRKSVFPWRREMRSKVGLFAAVAVLMFVCVGAMAADKALEVQVGQIWSAGDFGTGLEVQAKVPVGDLLIVGSMTGGLSITDIYTLDRCCDFSITDEFSAKNWFVGVGDQWQMGSFIYGGAVGYSRNTFRETVTFAGCGDPVSLSESESRNNVGIKAWIGAEPIKHLTASAQYDWTGWKQTSGYVAFIGYKNTW